MACDYCCVSSDHCGDCACCPRVGSATVPASAELVVERAGALAPSTSSDSASVSQSLEEAPQQRTLADYRPQHDVDCAVNSPVDGHGWGSEWNPKPCTCGLDDLLAVSAPLKAENEELKKSRRYWELEADAGKVLLARAEAALAEAKGGIESLRDLNARLQMKMTLNADEASAELSRLTTRISYLEGTAMPHARKQEHADGFQAGWHAALTSVDSGDSAESLRELIPSAANSADRALAALREQTDQEKAYTRGDQEWRSATAEEQEPLVERLGVMMYEVFENFAPEPKRDDESMEQFASRLRVLAISNIKAALRQVLVVTEAHR